MKTTLKLDLPTTDEIAADLERLTCYPQLTEAEQQIVAAEVALEDARQKLEDANTAADEMPAQVHAGKATEDDLTRAISAAKAAEVMLPFHKSDLADAQEALVEAKRQARAAVIEEGRRRRDALQGIADEISPVLEELRELEFALQGAVDANAPEPADGTERAAVLKLAPPVDPVRWTVSIAATRLLCVGRVGEIQVRH